MGKQLTTKDFIERARKIHGDKYIYDKVIYINRDTSVQITCPIHGDFWQKPREHIDIRKRAGCTACKFEKLSNLYRGSKEIFIERALKKHNNFYNYDKVQYVNYHTNVQITCPIHGDFWQTPGHHLEGENGKGCSKCGVIKSLRAKRHTHEQFLQDMKILHGDKYEFPDKYNADAHPIYVICKKHGPFITTPGILKKKNNRGCPQCSSSKVEKMIKKLIPYSYTEYKFVDLISPEGFQLRYDFYIPYPKLLIEYHGSQHYTSDALFIKNEEHFQYRKLCDDMKVEYAKTNNIPLLIIPDHELKKWDDEYTKNKLRKIIDSKLKSLGSSLSKVQMNLMWFIFYNHINPNKFILHDFAMPQNNRIANTLTNHMSSIYDKSNAIEIGNNKYIMNELSMAPKAYRGDIVINK